MPIGRQSHNPVAAFARGGRASARVAQRYAQETAPGPRKSLAQQSKEHKAKGGGGKK
jgi:hypothetical protein